MKYGLRVWRVKQAIAGLQFEKAFRVTTAGTKTQVLAFSQFLLYIFFLQVWGFGEDPNYWKKEIIRANVPVCALHLCD